MDANEMATQIEAEIDSARAITDHVWVEDVDVSDALKLVQTITGKDFPRVGIIRHENDSNSNRVGLKL